eukprot:Phypoly_transcript_10461.p1 GENE.Phypoly_transcript_10461~~Phypoly_transcript_10461.p1  ORF type:complete len:380 (+),score=61.90 Phypoly_transcript_10461:1-1140(+)
MHPPSVLLLTVVCASLTYILYKRRHLPQPPLSSSNPSLASDINSTSTHATITDTDKAHTNDTTKSNNFTKSNITYPQEPDYFPFMEAIPGRVRMGVKRMDKDTWIEIGPSFPRQLSLKKDILRDHRPLVWASREDESTALAKREVLDELVKHLPVHFPSIYKLKDGHMFNRATGDIWKVEGNTHMDPFEIANLLVQEDMCILEQEGDKLLLTAGCVCFPSKWNVREKFMKDLPLVHQPVPPFGKHLANPVMEKLLQLKADSPIWRANWSILDDLEGPDSLYLPHPRTDQNKVITSADQVGDRVMYRVERQTLTRLPKSNAILFTIRTYQRPLKEVAKHKEVIPKLIAAIVDMEPTMPPYKNRDMWMDVCIEYLTKQMNS